jgi:hypothetical protein
METMRLSYRDLGIGLALALLMAATRFHHFGSALHLPDASLAVFFLGGLALRRAALFGGYLIQAALIDYVAIVHGGVSDWCVTPAYAFLLPAYACMWWAGVWCSGRRAAGLRSLAHLAVALLAATTLAFLISNAGFYAFSGYFSDVSWVEYSGRVAKYFLPYLGSSVAYVAAAAGVQTLLALAARSRARAAAR